VSRNPGTRIPGRTTAGEAGEIYVAAAAAAYTGKPGPVVIIQDDRFDATASVTVCPLTTTSVQAPLARLEVRPSDGNGLAHRSHVMVDKVVTVPRRKIRDRLGRLSDTDLVRLDRALLVFLGLAG
jgi:mRNA interferase MazF